MVIVIVWCLNGILCIWPVCYLTPWSRVNSEYDGQMTLTAECQYYILPRSLM